MYATKSEGRDISVKLREICIRLSAKDAVVSVELRHVCDYHRRA